MVGPDADRCAVTVTVEACEIDKIGEVLALVRGLSTFDLSKRGGKWELDYRAPCHMNAERKFPVFSAHDCRWMPPMKVENHPLLKELIEVTISQIPPF